MYSGILHKGSIVVVLALLTIATGQILTAQGTEDDSRSQININIAGNMGQMFDSMDKNQDGKLSKDEYAAIFAGKLDVEENFKFFDKDANGFVEKAEYMSLNAGLQETMTEPAGQIPDEDSEDVSIDEVSDEPLEPLDETQGLEAALVQKAIDKAEEWANLSRLMDDGNTAEANKLANQIGFPNALVLYYYTNTLFTIAQSIENQDIKSAFTATYGKDIIELITEPKNLAKIKANNPNPMPVE